MPVDLKELLNPAHSALLLMECQEGVIGSGGAGRLNALADAVARHGTIAQIARVLAAARAAKVPVFYLTIARRADNAGATANCLLLALGRKGDPLLPGSPRQAIVNALAPIDGEFVLNRFHGVTPFHAGELDQLLRNLGVKTVVATGVSMNIGIPGMTIEAVNCGYQVVIPRGAVTGTPDEYVDAVFEHTLRLLATITTVDEVVAAWR
ncbi:MAG: isochorismatase family protein [Deltaproteobacteria bacterium]|nr:isochorismatase family protein [Deltaproteobacteria bacterium]MBI3389400.1 isochorismatase family protein [Deltaproteobacteria bacterium]